MIYLKEGGRVIIKSALPKIKGLLAKMIGLAKLLIFQNR